MTATCARLALPQACQAWYGSDELHLVSRAKLPCSRLAALLRRLQGLKTLSARSVSIINPLAIVIFLGLCKNICNLYLDRWGEPSPAQAGDCLGAVIEAGFMPALQVLNITQEFKTGGIQALLSVFCKGASPNLHSLNVRDCLRVLKLKTWPRMARRSNTIETMSSEKNVEAFADMVEPRKRLRSCIGLTELPDGWMEHGSVDARIRLLRSTLASLEACDSTSESWTTNLVKNWRACWRARKSWPPNRLGCILTEHSEIPAVRRSSFSPSGPT